MNKKDVVVIGSGPNGLSAAIRLAQAGLSVLVIEGAQTIGGGMRSAELTQPGFVHDVCSAIHPLSLASPYIRKLPLHEYGLEWAFSEVPVAHAYRPDEPILLHQDLSAASEALGEDGRAYAKLMRPFVENWQGLMEDFLGPLPIPPRHPITMTRFGLIALQSASGLARRSFRGERARAAFAGLAAHAMMPLEWASLAGFGMMLGVLAHAVGWPMAKGGSQKIANAMADYLKDLGGEIQTGQFIKSYAEIPDANYVLFDTSAKGLLDIAEEHLKPGYAREISRCRYGVGVCKVDWALSEPIPWTHPDYKKAATIHIGGDLLDISISEQAVWEGTVAENPYILLAQQSLFDPTRAPGDQQTAWAYCHVPQGSDTDYSTLIESQIERYAPGFRDTILARSVRSAQDLEAYNPNYVGGDINGGVQNLRQLYTRPAVRWNPYRIPTTLPNQKLYICSSATPPGGGVHGMCGYYAAKTVLKDAGIL